MASATPLIAGASLKRKVTDVRDQAVHSGECSILIVQFVLEIAAERRRQKSSREGRETQKGSRLTLEQAPLQALLGAAREEHQQRQQHSAHGQRARRRLPPTRVVRRRRRGPR